VSRARSVSFFQISSSGLDRYLRKFCGLEKMGNGEGFASENGREGSGAKCEDMAVFDGKNEILVEWVRI
jgi:hypothetical protein